MTDKEMHKLSRRELLQLLLTQGRETEKLRKSLEDTQVELRKLTENYERLKKRLDHKDEQIHGLRETLQKERTNRRIELDEAGSIAEAALRLNGIFEAAQKTAEQYLYNIRLMYDNKVAELNGETPKDVSKENPEDAFLDDPEESEEEIAEETKGKTEETAIVETDGKEAEKSTEETGEKSIEEEAEEPSLEDLFQDPRELPEEQDGKKGRKRGWGLRKRQSK